MPPRKPTRRPGNKKLHQSNALFMEGSLEEKRKAYDDVVRQSLGYFANEFRKNDDTNDDVSLFSAFEEKAHKTDDWPEHRINYVVKNFDIIDTIDDPDTGTDMVLVRDRRTGEIFGSIGGSADAKDFFDADIDIIKNGNPKTQFDQITKTLDRWQKKFGGKKINLYGHSLGGRLARQVKEANHPAVANVYVNSAPGKGGLVSEFLEGDSGIPADSGVADGVHSTAAADGMDIIHNFGSSPAETVTRIDGASGHSIKNQLAAMEARLPETGFKPTWPTGMMPPHLLKQQLAEARARDEALQKEMATANILQRYRLEKEKTYLDAIRKNLGEQLRDSLLMERHIEEVEQDAASQKHRAEWQQRQEAQARRAESTEAADHWMIDPEDLPDVFAETPKDQAPEMPEMFMPDPPAWPISEPVDEAEVRAGSRAVARETVLAGAKNGPIEQTLDQQTQKVQHALNSLRTIWKPKIAPRPDKAGEPQADPDRPLRTDGHFGPKTESASEALVRGVGKDRALSMLKNAEAFDSGQGANDNDPDMDDDGDTALIYPDPVPQFMPDPPVWPEPESKEKTAPGIPDLSDLDLPAGFY